MSKAKVSRLLVTLIFCFSLSLLAHMNDPLYWILLIAFNAHGGCTQWVANEDFKDILRKAIAQKEAEAVRRNERR